MKEIEEGTKFQLDFDKLGKIGTQGSKVIPCVVQDAKTGQVLILAYVESQSNGISGVADACGLW